MIIWRELEERAEMAVLEAEEAGINIRHNMDLAEELGVERVSLKRRLAAAIVALGLRLDAGAVEALDDQRLPA